MRNSKRYYFMYVNAIISSFAVIVLHTVANPAQLGITKILPSFYVIICIILGIIFSYGVPIFFMQSGANILNYRERYDTKTFFVKRIHKVVVPFIVWSIIGFFLIYGRNAPITFKNFISGFLSGGIVGPYWFFYNIIGFYLCAPFISLIITYGSRKIIKYTLLILVFVNTVIPIINILTKTQSLFSVSIPFIGAYAQYFIAGWYITNEKISKKMKIIIYTIGSLMLIFENIATIYYTFFVDHIAFLNYPSGIVKNFYDISMLPSFCVMFALFLFLKDMEPRLIKLKRKNILEKVAGLTFGIYLIHPFIVTWVLDPFNSTFLHLPLIIKIILDPFLVYLTSAIITLGIRKIGYLKWLVP